MSPGPRRTRVRITGTYFELTDRPGHPTGASGRIMISVAKRLVPSAVRRNTVKRIVREAWRAATHVNDDRIYLVRLRQYPGGRRPKGGARARLRPDAATPGVAPVPVMGLTTIKRLLRADVDRVFAGLQPRRAPRRVPPPAVADADAGLPR